MKRSNDFVLGTVILGSVAVIVAAVLWAREVRLGERPVHVLARFREVGNVRIGTPVVIRGVRAGKVEGMQLSSGGFVELRLALDPGVQLPRQPVVLLNESSLFGEWQATITEREAVGRDEEILRQLAETSLGDSVLPGATLPDIARLTAVAGRIAGDIASVAERVRTAFDDQAARELRGSIRNFAELSAILSRTVREQSANLTAMSSEVRGGVNSLVRSADLLRSIAERVDSSTARGEIRRIVEDAAVASRQLRDASQQLASLAERLGRSQDRLDAFLASSDSIASKINRGTGSLGLLVNDPALYRSTDSLLRELRSLIADMQRNPRRYFNVRIF
jgi:phospholipid/cholesterol/gamma-HCH transport system substrate-binding protein